MKLLIDNNLPPRLGRAINAVVEPDGGHACALRDKFPPDIKDVDWIGKLSEEKDWAVVTDDHRILKNHAEREAWRRTELVGFFLAPGWRKMTIYQKAARLILAWPKMEAQFALVGGGALFELPIGEHAKLRPIPL